MIVFDVIVQLMEGKLEIANDMEISVILQPASLFSKAWQCHLEITEA